MVLEVACAKPGAETREGLACVEPLTGLVNTVDCFLYLVARTETREYATEVHLSTWATSATKSRPHFVHADIGIDLSHRFGPMEMGNQSVMQCQNVKGTCYDALGRVTGILYV